MLLRSNRTLKFAFPLVAGLLLALFAIPAFAHTTSKPAPKPSVTLNNLTYRSFTLTDANSNGKKITGRLNTGGKNPQGWVDASYTVTEAQYVGFYGDDSDLKQYLVKGNYIIPVEVYVNIINQYHSTDVSLEYGSPIPGSLGEGGGGILAGNYQSNGSIIGTPNPYSPDDTWTAIPLR